MIGAVGDALKFATVDSLSVENSTCRYETEHIQSIVRTVHCFYYANTPSRIQGTPTRCGVDPLNVAFKWPRNAVKQNIIVRSQSAPWFEPNMVELKHNRQHL